MGGVVEVTAAVDPGVVSGVAPAADSVETSAVVSTGAAGALREVPPATGGAEAVDLASATAVMVAVDLGAVPEPSRRAAASSIETSGGSTGVVGVLPAPAGIAEAVARG